MIHTETCDSSPYIMSLNPDNATAICGSAATSGWGRDTGTLPPLSITAT